MTLLRTTRLLLILVILALMAAACGSGDDGASVREIGTEDGSASGSGPASGSASGSGSASAPASGSGSASAPAAGSGSASAPASGTDSADATESGTDALEDTTDTDEGGYTYASDVAAHRLVTRDICEVNEQLDADEIDFDAVAEIYADGGNSVNGDGSVRTLQGFATAEERLHGLDDHYDSPTPLDDFITAALEGTGPFDGASDAVRKQGVQKGVQNQVMVAWMIHELNAALEKAAAGEFAAAEGAPHNWDEAWAFYHGAEPGCSAYATADKRAENFGTVAEDGTTAVANEAIRSAMNEGRDALLAEDAEGAAAAAEEIERNLVIIYSQATIRYASIVSDDVEAGDMDAARTHQAEGLAFFRVIEPLVAQAGADVEAINAVFDLSAELGAAGGEEEVREALQPAFDTLGIDDEDIGELQ